MQLLLTCLKSTFFCSLVLDKIVSYIYCTCLLFYICLYLIIEKNCSLITNRNQKPNKKDQIIIITLNKSAVLELFFNGILWKRRGIKSVSLQQNPVVLLHNKGSLNYMSTGAFTNVTFL